MIIDFNEFREMTMPCMNNGTGMMTVKMYNDENYRIIPTRIQKGGCIGVHKQNSGDDLNYIISGTGKAICNGIEEVEMSRKVQSENTQKDGCVDLERF